MEDLAGYVVHPVVHQWARYVQNDQQRLDNTRLAVTMVGCAVPLDSERDFWMLQRRLLGHAEWCFHWIVKDWCQLSRLQDVDDEDGTILDENVEDVLNAFLGLGDPYRDQGKLEQAKTMYQRALQGREKALGKDHTSTLGTVNNLGNLFADQGKLEQAKRCTNGRCKATRKL